MKYYINEIHSPQPNRCDSCTHSEEQDGSNCYECVKGMADNFEAQPTEMRDATEEERKSTYDYIESISKPTGIQFDEVVEELDFVQEHPKVRTNLEVNNVTNKKQIVKDWLSTFNTGSATECFTAVQRLKAEVEG